MASFIMGTDSYQSLSISVLFISLNKMQQQQVRDLIEMVVQPLKQRIAQLEKQNEQFRLQMTTAASPREANRLRSSSREEPRNRSKEECREVRLQSGDKKKPVWQYARNNKPEKGAPVTYKSPPQAEKNKYRQVTAKIVTRYDSKEKIVRAAEQKKEEKLLSFEKHQQDKKIIGGQKFSETGSSRDQKNSENDSINGRSIKAYGVHEVSPTNPENSTSQQVSEQGGSLLHTPESIHQEIEN